MATITTSIISQLGNKADAKALVDLGEAAKKAKELLSGLAEASVRAFEGIEKLVHGAAERMSGVKEFAERMNMSAREVAALDKVAVESGSSAAAMESTITSLNSVVTRAASGLSEAQTMLQRFGLHAKNARGEVKSFDEIMNEVIQKMQGGTSGKRQVMADALGIDPKLIPLLTKGVDNFRLAREAALKANPFSDRDYENARMVADGFKKAAAAVTTLKDRLAVALFPVVDRVLKKFLEWTSNEQNLATLKDAIGMVADGLETLVRHGRTIAWMFAAVLSYKMGEYFLGIADGLKKAANAQTLLNLGLGGLRSLLTGGLFGLIVLIAEDLWTFHKGGESVTGWMMTKVPYAVEIMVGALMALSGAFVALTFSSGPAGIAFILAMIAAASLFHDAWDPLDKWWNQLWDKIFNKVADFYNKLPGFMRGIISLEIGQGWDTSKMQKDVFTENYNLRKKLDRALAGWDKGADFFKEPAEEETPSWLHKRTPPAHAPGAMPFLPAPSRAGGPANQVTSIGQLNLNVEGGRLDDPEAAARLLQQLREGLEDRGLSGRDNPARAYTCNQQTGVCG
jgi:hypothetical protein